MELGVVWLIRLSGGQHRGESAGPPPDGHDPYTTLAPRRMILWSHEMRLHDAMDPLFAICITAWQCRRDPPRRRQASITRTKRDVPGGDTSERFVFLAIRMAAGGIARDGMGTRDPLGCSKTGITNGSPYARCRPITIQTVDTRRRSMATRCVPRWPIIAAAVVNRHLDESTAPGRSLRRKRRHRNFCSAHASGFVHFPATDVAKTGEAARNRLHRPAHDERFSYGRNA